MMIQKDWMMKTKIIIFVLILVLCMAFGAGCGDKASEEPAADQQAAELSDDQNGAYETAKEMLAMMALSRQGMLDYLSSEAGGYTDEAAEAAVAMLEDKSEVDWFKEAEEAAIEYKDNMLVTKEEVLEQLSSESGDQFTPEEAEAAVEKVFEK